MSETVKTDQQELSGFGMMAKFGVTLEAIPLNGKGIILVTVPRDVGIEAIQIAGQYVEQQLEALGLEGLVVPIVAYQGFSLFAATDEDLRIAGLRRDLVGDGPPPAPALSFGANTILRAAEGLTIEAVGFLANRVNEARPGTYGAPLLGA